MIIPFLLVLQNGFIAICSGQMYATFVKAAKKYRKNVLKKHFFGVFVCLKSRNNPF